MIPIQELLNRIRWDPEFAKGTFELGYYDREENRIILIPFREVTFPPESPSTFQLVDPTGPGSSCAVSSRARSLQGCATHLASS
jgi:hypothetical protein